MPITWTSLEVIKPTQRSQTRKGSRTENQVRIYLGTGPGVGGKEGLRETFRVEDMLILLSTVMVPWG